MQKSKKRVKQKFSKSEKPLVLDKKIFFFIIKFFGIFIVLNLLIELSDLSFLTSFIANVSASFLGMQYLNNIIIGKTFFIITNSCTGLVSTSILASIIFALTKPELKKKIVLFLVGAIVLLIVNIPRIILVLYVSKLGFDTGLVHELTWFLMSAIVLIIWYYGTKRIEKINQFNELL
jgi:exosortase/archaeosortase family protein